MPGLNGTGPLGEGPGTGRGFGRCRCAPPRNNALIPPVREPEDAAYESEQPGVSPDRNSPGSPVMGAGQGGIPFGGGRGNAWGGGRGRRCTRW